MPNPNYVKGRKKEYKICKRLKEVENFEVAQRSAGSHSPIDIFAIDKINKTILFIQAKPDNFSRTKELEILEEMKHLNEPGWKIGFRVE